MGKWDFLRKQGVQEIEREESPDYTQRLAVRRREYEGLNFEALSIALSDAREVKDDLAAKLSDANLDVTVIERLVIEKLESAGLESVVAGGYRLTPSPEPVFQKKDARALREWAEREGFTDLLTINAQTLTSLAKEHFLNNGEPPAGVELTGTYTKLSRTKAR
jgi:hypothetical protein